jgi:hypothetical protein
MMSRFIEAMKYAQLSACLRAWPRPDHLPGLKRLLKWVAIAIGVWQALQCLDPG